MRVLDSFLGLLFIILAHLLFFTWRFKITFTIALHLVFLFVQRPVSNHQLRVGRLLALFQTALTQTDTSLQFVVIESIITKNKEVVFFVSLASLTLDVPVVLARHLVLVLLLVVVLLSFGKVLRSLLHRLLCGQEVSDELFAGFVHHTSDHRL